MTGSDDRRAYLRKLLGRLASGAERPRDVFAEARTVWLSGTWPGQHDPAFDVVAHDVLFMLADARELGVTHEDASVLLAHLDEAGPETDGSRERLYDHFMSVDVAAREALQESDEYYGPPWTEEERDGISFPDPEQRRLHAGVMHDPESVWRSVRDALCAEGPRDVLFLTDLVDDLMGLHADAFIDRLEQVVLECPEARAIVVSAHVGGTAPTPALERFWSLQHRLEAEDASRRT